MHSDQICSLSLLARFEIYPLAHFNPVLLGERKDLSLDMNLHVFKRP